MRTFPETGNRCPSEEDSVPRRWAFRAVTVKGYVDRVAVVADGQVIATHVRCYGRRQKVLDPPFPEVGIPRFPPSDQHHFPEAAVPCSPSSTPSRSSASRPFRWRSKSMPRLVRPSKLCHARVKASWSPSEGLKVPAIP